MLMERGDPGDCSDAGDLFSQLAKNKAKLREDFREKAIELGLQAFAKEKQFDALSQAYEGNSRGKGIRCQFQDAYCKAPFAGRTK